MAEICVVGLGNIGLPTAVTMAQAGHTVTGVDLNATLVESVNAGETHLDEKDLPELLSAVVNSGALHATDSPIAADVFVISVPTPIGDDNRPIMDYVQSASRAVGNVLRSGNLVILESTVPPGTTDGLVRETLEEASGLSAGDDFGLAHCPERVLPGQIMREIVENDRIVGASDKGARDRALALYRTFVTGEVFETDAITAELAKLSENIYRDVNIALANELATISEELGADAWRVIELANKHPRVQLHQPGPGVGGYCIPIAPWLLLASGGSAEGVIGTARSVNAMQPARTVAAALAACDGIDAPRVAVLGVAYKGGVGDPRMSPSTEVIAGLEAAGVEVRVHDPLVLDYSSPLVSLHDALDGADLALVLVDHPQFHLIDPADIAGLMRTRLLLDTRHAVDAGSWANAGFTVHRTGVGHSLSD
jgi:UDP-N-acetyl-D-mannosaminuronic acid dehydrogenase